LGGPWSIATTYGQGYQQVAIGTALWTGSLAGAGSQGALIVYNGGEPNGQIAMWNPLTNSWFADIRNFGGVSTYHGFIEYSPVHNVAVFGGGNNNPRKIWRLNADRTVTTFPDAPVDLGVQRANVVVDPVTGNFLVLGYGQLWQFDPRGSGTWTLQTGSRVPPSAVGNPGSPELDSVISASISNYGVVMYVTCGAFSCNTYLYKHAASTGGTPTPTPSATPTPTPTPTSTPTPTPTPSPGSTITMGEPNILSGDDSGNGNLLLAQQTTLSTTATLQSLSFYVTSAAGNLRLGVYDSSGPGGGPGTKKAETNSFTPTTGWNTANVITPVSLPPGTYWLAYLPSDSNLHFRLDYSGSARYYS